MWKGFLVPLPHLVSVVSLFYRLLLTPCHLPQDYDRFRGPRWLRLMPMVQVLSWDAPRGDVPPSLKTGRVGYIPQFPCFDTTSLFVISRIH